ncbi:MAG: hypothetical protein V4623_06980 [Pseudomonadota bacterium]
MNDLVSPKEVRLTLDPADAITSSSQWPRETLLCDILCVMRYGMITPAEGDHSLLCLARHWIVTPQFECIQSALAEEVMAALEQLETSGKVSVRRLDTDEAERIVREVEAQGESFAVVDHYACQLTLAQNEALFAWGRSQRGVLEKNTQDLLQLLSPKEQKALLVWLKCQPGRVQLSYHPGGVKGAVLPKRSAALNGGWTKQELMLKPAWKSILVDALDKALSQAASPASSASSLPPPEPGLLERIQALFSPHGS